MIQHKPILTDAEMRALICGNPFTLGLSIARLKDFIRQVEKAVVAKLVAEQEPVAWFIDDKRVCGNRIITDLAIAKDWLEANPDKVTPLYAHPMPCVSTTSDKTACVSESRESETQENVPFTPKTVSEMRSFIGMNFDSLQYANPETEEPDEMDRYTLTIHDLLSAFSWAGHYDCDHIPDDGKMVGLSLSVDTKETQALLQPYLDGLDGWQLVPPMPTDAMLKKAFPEIFDIDGISKNDLIERYQAMLAEAPKYTGDSNE